MMLEIHQYTLMLVRLPFALGRYVSCSFSVEVLLSVSKLETLSYFGFRYQANIVFVVEDTSD